MTTTRRPYDLEDAYSKLEWVTLQLPIISAKLQSFVDSKPYRFWSEPDLKRGGTLYKLKMIKKVPTEIAVPISNCLHQTRSSLDHLAVALAVRNKVENTRYVMFPINKSKVTFMENGIEKIKKLSAVDIEKIKSLKPYKGGDNLLYALNELNNVDKHNQPLLLNGYTASVSIANGFGSIETKQDAWGHLDKERTLLWIGEGGHYDFRCSVGISFQEVGQDPSLPLTHALESFVNRVKFVLQQFH